MKQVRYPAVPRQVARAPQRTFVRLALVQGVFAELEGTWEITVWDAQVLSQVRCPIGVDPGWETREIDTVAEQDRATAAGDVQPLRPLEILTTLVKLEVAAPRGDPLRRNSVSGFVGWQMRSQGWSRQAGALGDVFQCHRIRVNAVSPGPTESVGFGDYISGGDPTRADEIRRQAISAPREEQADPAPHHRPRAGGDIEGVEDQEGALVLRGVELLADHGAAWT